MPIQDGAVDFLAWYFDPRGLHSVRNAYKLQIEGEIHEAGTYTGSSMQRAEVLGGRGKDKWWRI
jgi:hypothetical protein